jgi:hypothetical protein
MEEKMVEVEMKEANIDEKNLDMTVSTLSHYKKSLKIHYFFLNKFKKELPSINNP